MPVFLFRGIDCIKKILKLQSFKARTNVYLFFNSHFTKMLVVELTHFFRDRIILRKEVMGCLANLIMKVNDIDF